MHSRWVQTGRALRRWTPAFVAVAVLAVGTYFRLFHYFLCRSLWLDEAMLALNIAERSYRELLRPLDYTQVAPVLFLWIERLALDLGGVGELALRAYPMLAGLALVPLLGAVARRLLGPAAAWTALALAAVSPTLIRYSNETKPYGPDALATTGLLWAAGAVLETPSARRLLVLLAVGWLAVLASFPALFVAGGVALALLLDGRARRSRGLWVAGCAAVWAATAGSLYMALYGASAASQQQQQGYGMAFLDAGPALDARLQLALRGSLLPTFLGDGAVIPAPSTTAVVGVAGVLLLGGAVVARRRGVPVATLLMAPLLLSVAASALRRYPLGVPRLMVFAAPLLILLVAAAASWPHERFGPRVGSALTAALGLLAVVAALRGDVASVRSPYLGEDARTLIDGLRKERHGVEPVYVSARGIPSWVFYTTNWEKPDRERLVFYARAASSGPCFENASPRGRPVAHEGFDLVYPRRGRVELLGIATGRQWKWPSYASESVDPGWAANEAQRIFEAVQARAQGSPCAWLYFTRLSEGSAKPLTWRLRDDYGGARHDWVGAAGGVLYRYCFPRERLGWPPGPGSSR